MDSVPIPVRKLVLMVALGDVADHAELRRRDAAAAVTRAAAETRLFDADAVEARVLTVSQGPATLEAAQVLPYTDAAKEGSKAISVDYVFSADGSPTAVVRVAVKLADVDGVTSLRIALHGFELLEDGEMSSPETFKKNPPYKYSVFPHGLNFVRVIGGTLLDIASTKFGCGGSTLGASAKGKLDSEGLNGAIVPNSAASLFAYWAGTPPPAQFRMYAPATEVVKPFKGFIRMLDVWKAKLGAKGFFVLMNFSPRVVPAEVPNAADLMSTEKRFAGGFDQAIAPPAEDLWPVNNVYHCRRIFVNNYGRHTFKTKATPTAFKWDWVGLASTVWGAGCAEINGSFFAWMRGTPEGLASIEKEAEKELGKPILVFDQIPKESLVPTKHEDNQAAV